MPMINCPECKNEISDSAYQCPSCGVQLRKPPRGFFGMLFKWAFILFNLAMLLAFYPSIMDGVAGGEGAGLATFTGGIVHIFWVLGDIVLGLFVLLTRPRS